MFFFNFYSDKRGVAALLTIVIVSAAVLVMAFSASILGLGELDLGFTSQKGNEAKSLAHGCVEESLRQLQINNSWVGNTLSLSDGSCIISVSHSGNDKTINVLATVDEYNKSFRVLANVSSTIVSVSSWQEI